MFDYKKLQTLNSILTKKAQFVPMDPSMAGGGMPPGDPSMEDGGMPPMDPSMGGMPPGDPSMGGMPPMDPSMGGMPPMDLAAMGAPPPLDSGEVSPTGEPYMKITPSQLSKLFKQFAEVFKSVLGIQGGASAPGGSQLSAMSSDPALTQKITELDAKLDAIMRS